MPNWKTGSSSKRVDWDGRIKEAIKLHKKTDKPCEVEHCSRPKTHPYPHFDFLTQQEIPVPCPMVFPDDEQEAIAYFVNRQADGGLGYSLHHVPQEKFQSIINTINGVGAFLLRNNPHYDIKKENDD